MYSKDFRKLALRLYSQYKNYRKVCSLLKISLSTLHRWRTYGIEITKRKQKTNLKHISRIVNDVVTKNPFVTIKDVQHVLKDHGIKRCYKTLCRYFQQNKITRKKAYHYCLPLMSLERERTFKEEMQNFQGCNKVSIDECYFSEKVLPHYGYAPKGTRVTTSMLPKSWKQRSLILAVSTDGNMTFEIYQGSINKQLFQNFVTSLNLLDDDKIILDNVRFHHCINADQCIFTPPYQPKYNPVEYCFAKIKSTFRKLSCDVIDVDERICKAIETISKEDILSMFNHVHNILKPI